MNRRYKIAGLCILFFMVIGTATITSVEVEAAQSMTQIVPSAVDYYYGTQTSGTYVDTQAEGGSYHVSTSATYETSPTSTGPNYGGTVVEDTSVGDTSWSSLSYILTENSQYAYLTAGYSAVKTSYYAKITSYGFSIPSSNIVGIVVEVRKYASQNTAGAYAVDGYLKLVKGGTIQGNDKADTSTHWGTSAGYTTYGSSSDLSVWGLSFLYSDINLGTFGVAFSAHAHGDGSFPCTAYVDAIRITVWYTYTRYRIGFYYTCRFTGGVANIYSLDWLVKALGSVAGVKVQIYNILTSSWVDSGLALTTSLAFRNATLDRHTYMHPDGWCYLEFYLDNQASSFTVSVDFVCWQVVWEGGAAPSTPTLNNPYNGATVNTLKPVFEWTGVSGATSYQVVASTSITFGTTVFNQTISGPTTWYNATSNLVAGTLHYWKVRALNAFGQSAYSSTWQFTCSLPSSTVTLLNPSNNSISTTQRPVFEWLGLYGGLGYKYNFELSLVKTFATVVVNRTPTQQGSNTYYNMTSDLIVGTVYYWKVRSFNNFSVYGSWSGVWQFTTPSVGIPTLINPSDDDVVNTLMPYFEWNGISDPYNGGVCNYQIQVSNASSFSYLNINANTTNGRTWYNATSNLASGTAYYWRVAGISSKPLRGSWSSVFMFIIGGVAQDIDVTFPADDSTSTVNKVDVFWTVNGYIDNQLSNPSYESGNFSGWQWSGGGSGGTTHIAAVDDNKPYSGRYEANLTTYGYVSNVWVQKSSVDLGHLVLNNLTFAFALQASTVSSEVRTYVEIGFFKAPASSCGLYYYIGTAPSVGNGSTTHCYKIGSSANTWYYYIRNITADLINAGAYFAGFINGASTTALMWALVDNQIFPSGTAILYADHFFLGYGTPQTLAIKEYNVRWAANNLFTENQHNATAYGLNYTVSSLTTGYWYIDVRYVDWSGEASAWSQYIKVLVDLDAPSAPQLFYPVNNQALTNKTVLVWNSTTDTGSGISYYHLQLSPNNFGLVSYNLTTASTYYQFETGVLAYQLWYWRVRAADKAGNLGSWSTVRYFYQTADPQANIVYYNMNNPSLNNAMGPEQFNATYHRNIQDAAGVWNFLSPYSPVINMYSAETVNLTVRDWMGNYLITNQTYNYAPTIIIYLTVIQVKVKSYGDNAFGAACLHRVGTPTIGAQVLLGESDINVWYVYPGSYSLDVYYSFVVTNGRVVPMQLWINQTFSITPANYPLYCAGFLVANASLKNIIDILNDVPSSLSAISITLSPGGEVFTNAAAAAGKLGNLEKDTNLMGGGSMTIVGILASVIPFGTVIGWIVRKVQSPPEQEELINAKARKIAEKLVNDYISGQHGPTVTPDSTGTSTHVGSYPARPRPRRTRG